ncbi:MAG: NAD-dependent epimerase/dehydratase family protein, partial [Planctomycetes bacterium]|nr:NAD-dependent epimerase/dehydratase family protein [Planctomycetota bacterium]
MNIAVTGATGFIGKALCARLLADGHEVRAISRDPDAAKAALNTPAYSWDD